MVDLDIKSYFKEVDHELLLKAVDRHVEEKWVKMYLLRLLETPVQFSIQLEIYMKFLLNL
ncbi:hypothetical protein [Ferruginibacter sp.]|uniref:hypothetical protein n=1 Tax=Ferruginibacter sp. TaxID=1940288 RepID=UPI002659AD02|nr:hypothetical protein [Ferruginibacter sp.]